MKRACACTLATLLTGCAPFSQVQSPVPLVDNPSFAIHDHGDYKEIELKGDKTYRIETPLYHLCLAEASELDYIIAKETSCLAEALATFDGNNDGWITTEDVITLVLDKNRQRELREIYHHGQTQCLKGALHTLSAEEITRLSETKWTSK